MAEATALRSNVLEYPIYGEPYTVLVPLLDADGDLVTGATTPDSEVSKNGDTFADCTNEATEIATNSGMYYLTLTATEMTADIVAIIIKSATAGMKTTPIVLYPRKLAQMRSGTCAGGNTEYVTLDGAASAVDDYYNGCVVSAVIDSVREVRVITDYSGSNQRATVTPVWNTAPDNDDTFIVYATDMRSFQDASVTLPQIEASTVLAMKGDQMDLVDAPNATALTAVKTEIETSTVLSMKSDMGDLNSPTGRSGENTGHEFGFFPNNLVSRLATVQIQEVKSRFMSVDLEAATLQITPSVTIPDETTVQFFTGAFYLDADGRVQRALQKIGEYTQQGGFVLSGSPSQATHNDVDYVCKQPHFSGSITEPGVGASWDHFWDATTGGPYTAWSLGVSYQRDATLTNYYYFYGDFLEIWVPNNATYPVPAATWTISGYRSMGYTPVLIQFNSPEVGLVYGNTFLVGINGERMNSQVSMYGSIIDHINHYAAPGDQMDLIDTPNATALTAVKTEIETSTVIAQEATLATIDGIVDEILLDTAEIGTAGAGLTALPAPMPVGVTTITYNVDGTKNVITLANGKVLTLGYTSGSLTSVAVT
jgi:hypothetical protein